MRQAADLEHFAAEPVYVCPICGYVMSGEKVPERCPVCGGPSHQYESYNGTGDSVR